MCRIFGFKSILESHAHNSLINAENALEIQSKKHSDGWGVAYYILETPHVIKSEKAALNDRLFKKISGIVRSKSLVAHIRKATQGSNNILNTHPFQFGPWIFVHNGHISKFKQKKERLLKYISKDLQHFILGTTDTEIIFYFLLSHIQKSLNLNSKEIEFRKIYKIINEAIKKILEIIGPLNEDSQADPLKSNSLTFILTNGSLMFAHQGGQELYYTTSKSKCSESSTCKFYDQSCENKVDSGPVNHLILSSEPISGNNIWTKLSLNQVVAVDEKMNLHIVKPKKISDLSLGSLKN